MTDTTTPSPRSSSAPSDPVPPKASKHSEVRYVDIHEDDELDEDQLRSWIEQASNLPGESM